MRFRVAFWQPKMEWNGRGEGEGEKRKLGKGASIYDVRTEGGRVSTNIPNLQTKVHRGRRSKNLKLCGRHLWKLPKRKEEERPKSSRNSLHNPSRRRQLGVRLQSILAMHLYLILN